MLKGYWKSGLWNETRFCRRPHCSLYGVLVHVTLQRHKSLKSRVRKDFFLLIKLTSREKFFGGA
jgi:hypothetical protein